MFTYESKIAVRYAETDQMGIVHHGNYAVYYELARTECFEACSGITYSDMEKSGVMLPVLELSSKFHKPAYYGETLTVKTIVRDLPSVRIKLDYEIFNEKEQLINTGSSTLVFVNRETRRPCQPPEIFMKGVRQYFES